MEKESYGEQRARQAAQVALEFARQMGGTFVADEERRLKFIAKAATEQNKQKARA